MKNKLDPAYILLLLACFSAPTIGGQLPLDVGSEPFSIPGFILNMFGQGQSALPSHFLIGGLAILSAIVSFADRKVIIVPNPRTAVLVALFFGTTVYAALISGNKGLAYPMLCEWLSFALAFFATINAVGRQRRVIGVLVAFIAGAVIVSVQGVLEYQAMKSVDPTWRIYGGWIQPNAFGSDMALALVLCTGLVLLSERLYAIAAGLATLPIATSLLLTQSRGSVVSYLAGWLILVVLALAWLPGRAKVASLGRLGLCLALVFGLFFGLRNQAKPVAAPPAKISATGHSGHILLAQDQTVAKAGDRLTNVGSTSSQSVGFRRNLWVTAIDLVKLNPLGYGFGGFFSHSAQPGLTTATQFAHNTLLQLAVEGSPVAALSLLALLGAWAWGLLSSAKKFDEHTKILRAAIFAAVICIGVDSLGESNLYLYGIGLIFFVLLGAGTQASADCSSPEFAHPATKRIGLVTSAVVVCGLGFFAYLDSLKSDARFDVAEHKPEEAKGAVATLKSLAPFDGEVHNVAMKAATDPATMVQEAALYSELKPTVQSLRTYANIAQRADENGKAAVAYKQALVLDPNNLFCYRDYLQFLIKTNTDEANRIAHRMIEIEDTTYFKVRSIPEFVPTETSYARVYLAQSASPKDAIALLEPVRQMYKNYQAQTLPQVKIMATHQIRFVSDDLKIAADKMKQGAEACKRLAKAYRDAGRSGDGTTAEADAAEFERVAAEAESFSK